MKARRLIDLTGQQIQRWTVLERAPDGRRRETRWLCRCQCGTVRVVHSASLRMGLSQSCGCLSAELAGPRNRVANMTHGLTDSSEYRTWADAKSRCANPNHHAYAWYGGRDITMCAEWASSFEAFLRDMGLRPSPRHSLDRIDNDGDYEPGNCRWATTKEQAENRRPRRPAMEGR